MPDRVSAAQRDGRAPALPPFSGMALDRAGAARHDPDWLAAQVHSPSATAVVAGPDGVLVDERAGRVMRGRAGSELLKHHDPILLGLDGADPVFALDLKRLDPDAAAKLGDGATIVGLREAGAILPPPEAGLAAYAVALLNWHRRHRFCANCGSAARVAEAGASRHCPNCGADHFPRTDPVVIMLVEHDDRLLLGRRAGWPEDRYSVLAGFVSPGEAAEEAVVREVREESGVTAHDPRFVASQPWPFPASLMLGFEVSSDGGEPVAEDGELAEVHWFTRDAVRSAALSRTPGLALPPRISIARFLIDRWLLRGG